MALFRKATINTRFRNRFFLSFTTCKRSSSFQYRFASFFPEPVLLLPQLFTVNRMRFTTYMFAAKWRRKCGEFEREETANGCSMQQRPKRLNSGNTTRLRYVVLGEKTIQVSLDQAKSPKDKNRSRRKVTGCTVTELCKTRIRISGCGRRMADGGQPVFQQQQQQREQQQNLKKEWEKEKISNLKRSFVPHLKLESRKFSAHS